eukprot:4950026-Alexandrium_andersonii.AAC.1
MSEARQSVQSSAAGDAFWVCLRIARQARKPLGHLFFRLQSKATRFRAKVLRWNALESPGPGAVREL